MANLEEFREAARQQQPRLDDGDAKAGQPGGV
jgi:hypothetical protein